MNFVRFRLDARTIAPGLMRTPIREAKALVMRVFSSSRYLLALTKLRAMLARMSRKVMQADRISTFARQALANAKPKARMVSSPQPIQSWIAGCLPQRWMDRIIARQLGLRVVPRD